MTVSFENNFEDMVALTEHLLSKNASFHKRRRWTLYGIPVSFLVAFAFFGYSAHDPGLYFAGICAATFSFLWSLNFYRNFPRKSLEKFHRTHPQKEVFCRHTITISRDGFSEETAGSKNFHTWDALFDIEFTPDYIFVLTNPAIAHIIPRRELGDMLFQQVCDEIKNAWNVKAQ